MTDATETEQVQIYINAEGKKVKKIIRKKKRPAPPQVDPATFKGNEPPPQTGTIFNIWYNKWSGGDREDAYLSKQKAKSRCNIAKHTGFTRADSVPGAFVCLFFARGLCPRGRDCEYLHRKPSTFDLYSGNVDCFGREKHSDYRNDMGGVGTFSRQNRTLYVGRIHPTDDVEEVVARHFAEWGNVDRIRVLPARGVAFVTYSTEAEAQFAKAAMEHQSLDNEEILNVRWATPDPNPVSQKREARAIEEQAAEAIRKALPEEFLRQITGDRGFKRQRTDGPVIEEAGLEGEEEAHNTLLLDDRAAEDAPENNASLSDPATHDTEQQNGLFGASTLAALKGYKPTAPVAKQASSNGPLVGYGEDSDSDG